MTSILPSSLPAGEASPSPDRVPSVDRVPQIALAGLTAALVALCVLLAIPFLPAITWGVALAIIAWPLHRGVSRRIGQPGVAAAVSTAIVVVAIVVPGLFVAYQLGREAGTAAEQVNREGTDSLRNRLKAVPVLHPALAWMDRVGLDAEADLRQAIQTYTHDLTGLARGSVTSIIQFLVAVFILFYLFRDRWAFLTRLREMLPLSRTESDRIISSFADTVHARAVSE